MFMFFAAETETREILPPGQEIPVYLAKPVKMMMQVCKTKLMVDTSNTKLPTT